MPAANIVMSMMPITSTATATVTTIRPLRIANKKTRA
jgi:hypothetical protein